MLDNQKKPCTRGNLAKNIGWQCMNFKFNQTLNIPGRSEISPLDKSVLKAMTTILKSIYSKRPEIQPFGTDMKRTQEFANELLYFDTLSKRGNNVEIKNVFESLTYAMTYYSNDNSSILKNHIDHFNCTENGFNNVFGIYINMRHPTKKNSFVRVVLLGYSRKSIPDYYKRREKRNLFKEHILKYIQFMGEERLNFQLSSAIPFHFRKNDKDEFLHKLPYADKCAFYSIFTSCIYDFMKRYENNVTIEHIIELVLPIGWITTGSHYFIVVKNIENNWIEDENLTIKVISELVKIGGSISSGPGSRLQPFCNFPLKKRTIFSAQKKIYEMIVNANQKKIYSR